jgi:hypothetical protein
LCANNVKNDQNAGPKDTLLSKVGMDIDNGTSREWVEIIGDVDGERVQLRASS